MKDPDTLLPVRTALETAEQFAERVDAIYSDHLDNCIVCDRDNDCDTCAAGVGGGHACNCDEGPGGYGFRLCKLAAATRRVVASPRDTAFFETQLISAALGISHRGRVATVAELRSLMEAALAYAKHVDLNNRYEVAE